MPQGPRKPTDPVPGTRWPPMHHEHVRVPPSAGVATNTTTASVSVCHHCRTVQVGPQGDVACMCGALGDWRRAEPSGGWLLAPLVAAGAAWALVIAALGLALGWW